MRNQTKEGSLLVASYAGKIGGTVTNRKNKLNKSFFIIVSGNKNLVIKMVVNET